MHSFFNARPAKDKIERKVRRVQRGVRKGFYKFFIILFRIDSPTMLCFLCAKLCGLCVKNVRPATYSFYNIGPAQDHTFYSFMRKIVILKGPCAPKTKACSISAVLEGPPINPPNP